MTDGAAKRLGFVGLGDMGSAMAERLLAAGADVRFLARRPEVIEQFRRLGGQPVNSLAELGAESDVVHVVVTGVDVVREVALGDNLLAGMRPGSVLVIHSTIDPEVCRELASFAAAGGIHVVDAPVSGGRERAERGDLTVMLGGEVAACETVAPLFRPFASLVRRMGDIGAGQIAKLVNNYFSMGHEATAIAEARFIEGFGLDVATALEVLTTCSGSSERFKFLASIGAFVHPKGEGTRLAMQLEELELMRRLARLHGVDLGPTESLVTAYLTVGRSAEPVTAGVSPSAANTSGSHPHE